MSKGKVKYFNDLKGWGFISGEGQDESVYVHYKDIRMDGFRTLKEGQDVSFEVIRTDHGPRAQKVTLTD